MTISVDLTTLFSPHEWMGIAIAAIIAVLALSAMHYWPHRNKPSQITLYIMGTVGWGVPAAGAIILLGGVRFVIVAAIVLAAGGLTVMSLYKRDKPLLSSKDFRSHATRQNSGY